MMRPLALALCVFALAGCEPRKKKAQVGPLRDEMRVTDLTSPVVFVKK